MERTGRYERNASKREIGTSRIRSRSPVKNRSPSPKKKPRTFSKYRRYSTRSGSSSSSSSRSPPPRRKSYELSSVISVVKPKESVEDKRDDTTVVNSNDSSEHKRDDTTIVNPNDSVEHKRDDTTIVNPKDESNKTAVVKHKVSFQDEKDNQNSKIGKGTVVKVTKIKRVEGFRNHQPHPSSNVQTHCIDYDVLGFCVMGEQCPFDHGQDPVIITNVLPVNEMNYKSKVSGDGNFYPPQLSTRRPCAPIVGEYQPENPGFGPGFGWPLFPPMRFRHGPWPREQMFPNHQMAPFPFPHERGLITHSFNGHQNMTSMDLGPVACNDGVLQLDDSGRQHRNNFDYRRLGKKKQENTSLVVKKIPVELNNIHDLNGYFLRFGKIVNIQINFENDPESALITFATKWEAKCACRCTEAVFNNRFIRVMWYKEYGNTNKEVPLSEAVPAVQQQSSVFYSGYKENENFAETNPSVPDDTNRVWSAKVTENLEADAENHVLSDQENFTFRDLKMSNKKKLVDELRKRRQIMAEKQIKQQKQLISKLETNKATMKPKDRQELMGIIKSLQKSIETLIKVDVEEVKSDNEIIVQENEITVQDNEIILQDNEITLQDNEIILQDNEITIQDNEIILQDD